MRLLPKRRFFIHATCATAVLCLLTACLPQSLTVLRKEPSHLARLGVTSLAVDTIQGDGGNELAFLIAHRLVKDGDVGTVMAAPSGQPSASPWRNAETLAGNASAAGYTLSGILLTPTVRTSYQATESGEGAQIFTTYTRTTSVVAGAIFHLVDGASGTVVDSFELYGEAAGEPAHATLHGSAAANASSMASLFAPLNAQAQARAAHIKLACLLAKLFTPTYKSATIEPWQGQFRPADAPLAQQAKLGNWSPAAAFYAEQTQKLTSGPAKAEALYYHGLALAYGGKVAEGVVQLEASQRVHAQPATARALQTVRAWL